MNNEITTKWDKTGLLDGLDDFNKNECAVSLEKAASLLTGEMRNHTREIDKIYDDDGFFVGSVLPIIRRLYSEGEGMPEKAPSLDIRVVMKDYYIFCLSNWPLYKDLTSYDIAGDVVADFCQQYINEFVKSHK